MTKQVCIISATIDLIKSILRPTNLIVRFYSIAMPVKIHILWFRHFTKETFSNVYQMHFCLQ